MTCSIWFRIQRIIQKCPVCYSTFSSVFRVLFKIRPAASGSGFSVLLKHVQVLFSVWFTIQVIIQNKTCSVWFRIQRFIKKCPGYYSAQLLVHYSGYYSKYDRQRLVQNSAYYEKMSRVLFSFWFRIQHIVKIVQGLIQRLVQYSAYYSKLP